MKGLVQGVRYGLRQLRKSPVISQRAARPKSTPWWR